MTITRSQKTVWYQLLWADNTEWQPTACCVYWYQRLCPTDPTNYWYLNGFNHDSPQGSLNVGGTNSKINPKVQGELRLDYWQDVVMANLVLEYAEDYSWMIRGITYDDSTGLIDVVAKTPSGNAYAVARALELAKKYNLAQVHYLQHSKDCDYEGTINRIKSITEL